MPSWDRCGQCGNHRYLIAIVSGEFFSLECCHACTKEAEKIIRLAPDGCLKVNYLTKSRPGRKRSWKKGGVGFTPPPAGPGRGEELHDWLDRQKRTKDEA